MNQDNSHQTVSRGDALQEAFYQGEVATWSGSFHAAFSGFPKLVLNLRHQEPHRSRVPRMGTLSAYTAGGGGGHAVVVERLCRVFPKVTDISEAAMQASCPLGATRIDLIDASGALKGLMFTGLRGSVFSDHPAAEVVYINLYYESLTEVPFGAGVSLE